MNTIRNFSNEKYTLDDMKFLAQLKKGKCVSDEYINSQTPLKWKCKYGHQWEARQGDIRRGGWCPECNLYFGETMSRQFFENIFEAEFKKSYPDWLVGKELDGYNQKLGIAFEFQGEQHYKIITYFKMSEDTLKKNQENDVFKKNKCEEMGVILIQIPYWIKLKNMQNFIIDEFNEKSGKIIKKYFINYHDFELYTGYTTKELQSIAEGKGGKLISKFYAGSGKHLLWECSFGHQWEAIPSSIKSGHWCPICARVHKLDIKSMKSIAKEKDGECISPEYINSSTPLCWQCKESHTWWAYPNDVKNKGTWCPYCAGLNKKTIQVMKIMAKSRNGKCLSTMYKGMGHILKWQCNLCNNQWLASPSNIIYNNSWCPKCANSRKSKKMLKYGIEDMIEVASRYNDGRGKFLSTVFMGTHRLHYWKCGTCDYIWQSRPYDVITGHWCPNCANNIRKTINDMNKLATQHDDGKGRCLSKKYINSHSKLLWKCGCCGYEWNAKPNSIQQGKWCPKCSGNLKITIYDIKEFVHKHRGTCLSSEKEIKNNSSIVRWECQKGHHFSLSTKYMKRRIKNKKLWCPKCSGKTHLDFEDIQRFAQNQQGYCLSKNTDYKNVNSYLYWKCRNNHEFKATYRSLRQRTKQKKNWCSICYKKKLLNKIDKKTLPNSI